VERALAMMVMALTAKEEGRKEERKEEGVVL